MGDREGGEAEIGLGLAAARREEQQIDDLAVGMCLVYETGQVQQDEGELERTPPRRPLDAGIDLASVESARSLGDRVAAPGRARHGLVHDAEGEPGASVAFENDDPLPDSGRGRAHPRDDARACRTPTTG